jgi:sigma-B regulation protein RsbU (phosphoserine phosphatase)
MSYKIFLLAAGHLAPASLNFSPVSMKEQFRQSSPPPLASAANDPLSVLGSLTREDFLLRALMDSIPDRIYFKDTSSRFLCVNRAKAQRCGLSDPAQVVGKSDADFFSPTHAVQALADELQVMRTGKPLIGLEEMETWPDGSITWASTTKMPLRDHSGKIIGTFGISRDITDRKRAELLIAERTNQLRQKNQQVEEQLKMAHELQLAMLPQQYVGHPRGRATCDSRLEFFTFYLPSGAVSGDFFDIVELSPTRVGVFICDVMGHDVRAALITAMLRALIEDLDSAAGEPGQLLAQINRGLVSVFKQAGAAMYATAFYLVADVEQDQVSYASAAHPEPILLRRNLGVVERLESDPGVKKGPALGLFENATFPTSVRSVAAGDLITLFTDGLTEVESPSQQPFTAEGLAAAVACRAQLASGDVLQGVFADIREFSGRPEFDDDVCLVGLEVKRLAARRFQASA